MTSGDPARCGCVPAWPQLVVRLHGCDEVPVEPSATPGGLAHLYHARCVRCGARYPGAFRLPPRTRRAA